MKLGILKADAVRPEWVPEFGEYPDMFIALLASVDPAMQFAIYDVQEGEYPADIDEVDAYLITGSKSSVYDDETWIYPLMEFVRELHAQRKKLIGVCFGHQLIAHALGGSTQRSPKGWGVGVHRYKFQAVPNWHDGASETFDILVSHQDQVITPAEGARVIAGSAFCENAVTQLGDHILTIQGHPEFIPAYSVALMNLRRERLGEEIYQQGMASLAEEPQGDRVALWLHNFVGQ